MDKWSNIEKLWIAIIGRLDPVCPLADLVQLFSRGRTHLYFQLNDIYTACKSADFTPKIIIIYDLFPNCGETSSFIPQFNMKRIQHFTCIYNC